MNTYLPTEASIDEACEWLTERTGEQWPLPRLLEAGLQPWVWLDYSPDAPSAVFGDRHEGFLAPFVFWNDTRRLSIERQSALMTMTRNHEGMLMKISPGLPVELSELRFKREDVEQLAAGRQPHAQQQEPAEAPRSTQTMLDMGVTKAEILAVFPNPIQGQTEGQWKRMLGDVPGWLKEARIDAGGRSIQSRWNPAKLAMCLAGKGHMGRGALGSLIRRHFLEYLPEWEAYAGSFERR